MILWWVPYTHHPEATRTFYDSCFFSYLSIPQALLLLLTRNDILTCWLWRQFLTHLSLAFPTRAFCHTPDNLVLWHLLPCPIWAEELESGDFLKWVKTKETHSSSGSDLSGWVCLSCNVTPHAASFSETSPETAKFTPLWAHSWEPRWTQNMAKAIPKSEKIPGSSVKFLFLSWGDGSSWKAVKAQDPLLSHRRNWFSSLELPGSDEATLRWQLVPALASRSTLRTRAACLYLRGVGKMTPC